MARRSSAAPLARRLALLLLVVWVVPRAAQASERTQQQGSSISKTFQDVASMLVNIKEKVVHPRAKAALQRAFEAIPRGQEEGFRECAPDPGYVGVFSAKADYCVTHRGGRISRTKLSEQSYSHPEGVLVGEEGDQHYEHPDRSKTTLTVDEWRLGRFAFGLINRGRNNVKGEKRYVGNRAYVKGPRLDAELHVEHRANTPQRRRIMLRVGEISLGLVRRHRAATGDARREAWQLFVQTSSNHVTVDARFHVRTKGGRTRKK